MLITHVACDQVLEGHVFLGTVAQMEAQVQAAFASVIASSSQKVVRGVLLTRSGYEEKARAANNMQVGGHPAHYAASGLPRSCLSNMECCLQELLRWMPSDLFRTCLRQLLGMIFDVLVSHFHMTRWHKLALDGHEQVAQHISSMHGIPASAWSSLSAHHVDWPFGSNTHVTQEMVAIEAEHGALLHVRVASGSHASTIESSATKRCSNILESKEAVGAAYKPELAQLPPAITPQHAVLPDQHITEAAAALAVKAAADSTSTQSGAADELLSRDATSDEEQLDQRRDNARAFGLALRAAHEGLQSGRQAVWDQAANVLGVILSAPAAFEGEHFLQVRWILF